MNAPLHRAITVGGPLLALAFLMFWFAWTSFVSFQFALCLIVYDGILSYIDVNHSALLADLASTEHERARYSMYNAMFSGIGSVSVFISFVIWNPDMVYSFQMFCVVLSCISAVGFYVCGLALQ